MRNNRTKTSENPNNAIYRKTEESSDVMIQYVKKRKEKKRNKPNKEILNIKPE
jgi:hypothetical protein|tara:strand:+ start:2336 stop:2494 length:159 start_codon:yes stop_codon:yes gene_type:complete